MPIVVCPQQACSRQVAVAEEAMGKTLRCPHCGQVFRLSPSIPTASPAVTLAVPVAPPPSATLDVAPLNPTASYTPATPLPPTEPVRIGRFEVRTRLGEGAFGVVYRAYDAQLDREVALKVAKPQALSTEIRVKRFLQEAKSAGNLRHPHIVPVFDSGRDGEQYYIASAFIAGRSLEVELNERGPDGEADPRRPLDVCEAARLVQRLAEALAYAHKKGVIHRDIKPANVLLDEQAEPMLVDFGLAARPEGEEKLTQEGTMMGTPAYMAPEQGQGKAEAASDQYSLGCSFYELLTGRTPFSGPPELQLFLHQTQEATSPRKLNSKVPLDLETICLKCLEKEAGRRYAGCQALADDLRRWLEGEPILARRLSVVERAWRWGRKNPALAALLLVTLLGVLGIVWKYREAEREAAKAEQASDYLASIFELADANGQRGTMTARQILDDAEKNIPQQFADQSELRDKLLKKIGTVYDKLTEKAPLAMILEVRGKVETQSERNGKKQAAPQTLLYAGDRLSLNADAQVQVVVLSDLHKERLKPGREVTVRRKGCEPADAISERDEDMLMTFVRLPKRTFYMGWDDTTDPPKKGVETEIKEDFEIAVHDVTQGQWQAIMGDNPSYFSRFGGRRKNVKDISDEELKLFPVEAVSWDDAQEFIGKLNQKERGRGYLYRLPTEAEWEYACRGGATSEAECSYHFYFAKPTNDLSSDRANFDGDHPFGNAPQRKGLDRPTRVGAYPPNKLGLCDMHGNVWQWCQDIYQEKGSPRVHRVNRGGGWIGYGASCKAGIRSAMDPTARNFIDGFRLVRVPVR